MEVEGDEHEDKVRAGLPIAVFMVRSVWGVTEASSFVWPGFFKVGLLSNWMEAFFCCMVSSCVLPTIWRSKWEVLAGVEAWKRPFTCFGSLRPELFNIGCFWMSNEWALIDDDVELLMLACRIPTAVGIELGSEVLDKFDNSDMILVLLETAVRPSRDL